MVNFGHRPAEPHRSADKETSLTRLYQDYSFTVLEAVGRPVSKLIGIVDDSSNHDDLSPIQVYAQLGDPIEWHIMFLDTCAAFWDTRTIGSGNDELANLKDDECRLVDYANKIGGLPRRIRTARAYIGDTDGRTYLQVVLDNDAELRLVPDSDELDMGFTVEFKLLPESSIQVRGSGEP